MSSKTDVNILRGLGMILILAGLGYLFLPLSIFQLFGLRIIDAPAALTDLRATYAGIQLGLGIMLIIWSRRDDLLRDGIMFAVVCFSCIAAVRFLGVQIDGGDQVLNTIAALFEAGVAGLLLWRLKAIKSATA